MGIEIDYIEFDSADRAATEDFFERAFGWSFVSYGPDYSGIENAGLDGGVAQGGGRPPLVLLYADDIDAAEAAARAAGAVITQEQFDFPGGRRFHFREPGGNELGVWTGPRAGEESEGR